MQDPVLWRSDGKRGLTGRLQVFASVCWEIESSLEEATVTMTRHKVFMPTIEERERAAHIQEAMVGRGEKRDIRIAATLQLSCYFVESWILRSVRLTYDATN